MLRRCGNSTTDASSRREVENSRLRFGHIFEEGIVRRRNLSLAFVVMLATLVVGAGAQGIAAAKPDTIYVAKEKSKGNNDPCSNPQYKKIQPALNAAAPGETVFVCPGTYIEGGGGHGENALTIRQDVNLVGAGAGQVTVEPRNNPASNGQIAADNPNIRSGKGVIIAAVGKPDKPITVNIIGITVDANGVYATAGVIFLDAKGSINRSRVTGLAIDESADGFNVPGGFRSNPYGIGIAHVTAAPKNGHAINPEDLVRTLTIDHTRVDTYNAIGVLVDGATNDYSPYTLPATPLVPSGVLNKAVLTNDQIVGRNSCQNFNDPSLPPPGVHNPTLIDGNCQASGGSNPIPPPLPLSTGPLFGQDGVRVTAGASLEMSGDTVSSSLVHGENRPIGSVFAPTPNNDPYPLGNHAENNQNLRLGAAVRLVGAAASTI